MQPALLGWFAEHGRDLPWRKTRDPYSILVSEVMLQQTQVERVVPRYLRWLERWPTAEALAEASTADVILEWQGLGYNRRAVNLQRAARAVAASGWPEGLAELPGVGPYTAAAVGSFAFGRAVLPVDTRLPPVAIERLLASMRVDEPVEPGDALIVATSGTSGARIEIIFARRLSLIWIVPPGSLAAVMREPA